MLSNCMLKYLQNISMLKSEYTVEQIVYLIIQAIFTLLTNFIDYVCWFVTLFYCGW